jgi:hypothetical protein
MSPRHSLFLIGLAALLGLTWACGCSTKSLRNPYETEYDPNDGMDADRICANFNLHRGRWWNYYQRGSWLLAGRNYAAAAEDFNQATDQRYADRWDARIYGMRFIDYFPHREWGIALCLEAEREGDISTKEKRFREAIEQLQISLDQEPSSKAWFYLNRARGGYWRTTQADTTSPAVTIGNSAIGRGADVPTLYINQYAVPLEIRARDRQSGVEAVWVDGRRLFIESVKEEFDESVIVTVGAQDQTKTVFVKAIDLAGNESPPAAVRLIVDTTPPVAAITIHPVSQSLGGGPIPVEVAAADDHGLKSIQVGQDLYDGRECRGQTAWEGVLFAKAGTRDLIVRVTDLAGNVTATSIVVEPRQGTSRGYGLPRFEPWPSLNREDRPWRDIWGATPPWVAQVRPSVWAWPGATRGLRADPGLEGLARLASYQTQRPAPTLEFREVRDRTLVQTTHDCYLLQGEVRYAQGPVTIIVTIGGKELRSNQVTRRGDYVMFCSRVPLPEAGREWPVVVKVLRPDGRPVDTRQLRVKRVADPVYEPSAVYAVMLLPLEEKLTPTDPNSRHRDPGRAHEVVLTALRARTLHDPNNLKPSYPRFDCTALRAWAAPEIRKELSRLGVAESSPETTFATLAKQGQPIELGFFGEITEDANSLQIKLWIIDVERERLMFVRPIDVFGSKGGEPDWHTKGLIARLQKVLPRVHGEIADLSKNGRISVDRGRIHGVFPRMDVGFYEKQEAGCLRKRGEASVADVRRDSSIIEVKDQEAWDAIYPRWRSFAVISK